MIRKTVLSVLALMLLGTAAVHVASDHAPVQFARLEPIPPCGWTFRRFLVYHGRIETSFWAREPWVPYAESGAGELFRKIANMPYPPPPSPPTLSSMLRRYGFSVLYWTSYRHLLNHRFEVDKVSKGRWLELRFPTWFLFMLFAPYPTIAFVRGPFRRLCWRYSRRYRRERGLCERCAYDLTGNTSGVCPECGTKIAAAEYPV